MTALIETLIHTFWTTVFEIMIWKFNKAADLKLRFDVRQFFLLSLCLQSFGCSVYHMLIQSYLRAAVSFREGLYLCAQTPSAPALRGDLLRELRPRHHHHALLRLRDRDQAGQPIHLQQHREVHITQNSLYTTACWVSTLLPFFFLTITSFTFSACRVSLSFREEYGKLFDFVNAKKLSIKNRGLKEVK